MEYIVLAVVAVVALLLLLPRRAPPRPVALLFLAKPAIVGAALIGGWIAWSSFERGNPADVPHERLTDQTMEYAQGDDQLRAILESAD